MKADKVYLVGFMGAGKTTVARALARRLDWQHEDIDERIEQRERRDIPTIFRQEGEPYFRSLEREELDCAALGGAARSSPPAAGRSSIRPRAS